MSDALYHHVSQDTTGARVETTKYEEEPLQEGDYVGYLAEEINWPNPNPQGTVPHKGEARGPYAHTPEPKDYPFDVPIIPVDANIPLEISLGARATTDETTHDKHLFTETDKLATATFHRFHQTLDLHQAFIGAKAGLTWSSSLGEPVTITLNCLAPKMSPDYNPATPPDVSPPVKAPFMGWMLGSCTIDETEFATVRGVEFSIDHGLESHPGGEAGREGQFVMEETGSEKYNSSLEFTITDVELFQKAANDATPFDVELPYLRDRDGDPSTDAMILRQNGCKMVDAPIGAPDEGTIQESVDLSPKSTEVEIREPK